VTILVKDSQRFLEWESLAAWLANFNISLAQTAVALGSLEWNVWNRFLLIVYILFVSITNAFVKHECVLKMFPCLSRAVDRDQELRCSFSSLTTNSDGSHRFAPFFQPKVSMLFDKSTYITFDS
jgi:hypothetical protein